MRLSAQDLVQAYEFLYCRPPFAKWELPSSEQVHFRVIRSRMQMGEYDVDPHTIMVSCRTCENWLQVLETVAHEMVHMACELKDYPNHPEHDKHFKRLAKQVCTAFGWETESF